MDTIDQIKMADNSTIQNNGCRAKISYFFIEGQFNFDKPTTTSALLGKFIPADNLAL